jgi:hypothetical protein
MRLVYPQSTQAFGEWEDVCNIPFAPRGAPPAKACARRFTAAGR